MAQSLLATDGYKFSMAEAGWPLRTETFYYSHRKGGPQVLPIDVPAFVRSLLPRPADDDYRYLAEHSYEMGPGFKAAIVQTDALEIRALPRGAVFYDREPVFTVTGPSALVSWLEPLVLMLHYRIQVASRAGEVRVVTCERQREIVRETLDAVGRGVRRAKAVGFTRVAALVGRARVPADRVSQSRHGDGAVDLGLLHPHGEQPAHHRVQSQAHRGRRGSTAYLGTQGDVWDAQKDMALAGLGVLLAMILRTLVNTWLRRDFAREWVEGIGVRDAPPPPAASIKRPGSLRRHNPL